MSGGEPETAALKIDFLDVTLSVAKGLAGLGLHLLRCFPSALPAEQAGWFRTGASLKHGSFHASVVRPKRMTTAVMWRVLVLILYLGLASGCDNGPIGEVKLKFFSEYTRFENLARGGP